MGTSGLSTCGKCMKLFFILLNIIYLGIGIALIAVGAYLIGSGNSLSFFTGNNIFSGAAILIICGIVVFVITAVGILGAFFQLKFVLYLYILVVVIIIILEVVATILGFVYRDTISDTAQDRAVNSVYKYTTENSTNFDEGLNKALDYVQETFECCGWVNVTIWLESPYYIETMLFPPSCECSPDTDVEKCMLYDEQLIFNNTCDNSLSDTLRNGVAVVGILGVVFAIAQVIPILLVIALLYAMHKNSEYVTV